MWVYKGRIDVVLLENRLRAMGLVSEWKAFAAYTADYLGMPQEALPVYENAVKWHRKADWIQSFILKTENFGHNHDSGYLRKYPYLIRKVCSLGIRICDIAHHMRIFPWDSMRFFPMIVINGLRSAANAK